MLQKDILSNTRTVQVVREAGWRLQLPGDGNGACAEGLQGKLQQLSHRWSQVLAETERRQLALEHNLSQVKLGGGPPGQAFPGLEASLGLETARWPLLET